MVEGINDDDETDALAKPALVFGVERGDDDAIDDAEDDVSSRASSSSSSHSSHSSDDRDVSLRPFYEFGGALF